MTTRFVRLASTAVLAAVFVLPGPAIAADPDPGAPPAAVTDWQEHLAHMRTMEGNLGAHVGDCVALHGSMAGMPGPNGAMTGMMTGMMSGMMSGSVQR